MPKNQQRLAMLMMTIMATGVAPKFMSGAATTALMKSKTLPHSVKVKPHLTKKTTAKIIMAVKAGESESDTMGGTESGRLSFMFLRVRNPNAAATEMARMMATKRPSEPR